MTQKKLRKKKYIYLKKVSIFSYNLLIKLEKSNNILLILPVQNYS